jgi:tRNA(His) 5'-end guanylyltransferase
MNPLEIEDQLLIIKRNVCGSLDDAMKIYENRTLTTTLPDDRPLLIRLDGHCFSRFTNKFPTFENEPFSDLFTKIMIKTANSLMNDTTFKPTMAYTHSDEITLLFNGFSVFNQRSQKWLSLLASKTSSYFQLHLKYAITSLRHNILVNKDINNLTDDLITALDSSAPSFDARVIFFPVGNESEIVNYFIWRSQRDCFRNCVSAYASMYMSKKDLNTLNTTQKLNILQDKHNLLLTDIKLYLQYGVFIKKTLTEECIDGYNIFRKKNIFFSIKFTFGLNILELCLQKYVDNTIINNLLNGEINPNIKDYCQYDSDFEFNIIQSSTHKEKDKHTSLSSSEHDSEIDTNTDDTNMDDTNDDTNDDLTYTYYKTFSILPVLMIGMFYGLLIGLFIISSGVSGYIMGSSLVGKEFGLSLGVNLYVIQILSILLLIPLKSFEV